MKDLVNRWVVSVGHVKVWGGTYSVQATSMFPYLKFGFSVLLSLCRK